MKLPDEAVLLRVFIGESDSFHHRPLYEQIVLRARELGLAGATVLRGIMGFGAGSHIHTAKLLDLSVDLPVVIEIVDTQANIDKLLPFLDETLIGGLVTMEKIRVIKYRSGKSKE